MVSLPPLSSPPHQLIIAIKSLTFIFVLPRKKDHIVRIMKQNHTKHVYFSLFNPLKVTDKFEIEILGRVRGGELFMGLNQYKPIAGSCRKKLILKNAIGSL